jgi:uncharacterized membrane protein YeaQ/YmgE (transglycosylase-associated protein family)
MLRDREAAPAAALRQVENDVARRLSEVSASYNPSSRCEATMSILWTIIIGLVVGALAKFVMPGKDPGGIIITILLGIVGAFVGTFIGRALGLYGPGQAAGWIMSVVGAIIVLAIYRAVTGRRGPVV